MKRIFLNLAYAFLIAGCSGSVDRFELNEGTIHYASALAVPKVMSRGITCSTLAYVFGVLPSATEAPAIADCNTILESAPGCTNRTAWFGGGVDNYQRAGAPSHAEALLPFAGPLPSRFAIERTCDQLVAKDACLNFAAQMTGAASATAAPPTEGQLSTAFELFHPGREPSPEVMQSLRNVADGANSQFKSAQAAWQMAFLTLCLSPSWQIQ